MQRITSTCSRCILAALVLLGIIDAPTVAQVRNLTSTPTVQERWPSWHPAGALIAFSASDGGEPDLYTISTDGTGLRRLTDDPATDFQPSWAPDGERLAFVSQRGDGQFHIYVMDIATGALTALTASLGFDLFPDWSPGGNQIVFSHLSSILNYDLYLVRPDGSGLTQLTDTPVSEASPVWSPDGEQIAYRRGGGEIWVMRLADNAHHKLADGVQPSWSPSGRQLAFVTVDFNGLRLLDIASGAITEIAVDAPGILDVDWSPDGRFLVAAVEVDNQELFIIPTGLGRTAVAPVGWARIKLEISNLLK